MAITPLDWTDAAACRDSEGALFYPADSAERKEDRLRTRAGREENLRELRRARGVSRSGARAPRVLRDLGRTQRIRTTRATAYVSGPTPVGRDSPE